MKKNINTLTAEILLKIGAVSINADKPFRYASGILSPIYIDNRLVMSFPKIREKIVNFYIKIIKEKIGLEKIEVLSGTATAAIPITAFIAQKLILPMVYVRDTKKGHGKENQIEGFLKRGQKVVVIEDHISTGGSLVGNVRAIREAGGKVNYAVATTTYSMKEAEKNFVKEKLRVYTLTDFKTIIEVAVRSGVLNKKDKDLVLEWSKNPKIWGKKFGFEK